LRLGRPSPQRTELAVRFKAGRRCASASRLFDKREEAVVRLAHARLGDAGAPWSKWGRAPMAGGPCSTEACNRHGSLDSRRRRSSECGQRRTADS
jgi:hypothetical protein